MTDKSVGAKIVGNAGILITTQVMTKILGAALTIVVARILGAQDYGLYGFSTTFGFIFGLLTTFGLAQLIPREVTRRINETGKILGDVFTIESWFSLIAFVVMIGVLLLLQYPAQRLWIAGIIGLTMILNAQLDILAAFFRGHQRMGLEAVQRIFLSVLNLGLGLAVLITGHGVLELAIVQLIACILALSLAVFLLVRKLARPVFARHWPALRKLLAAASPFALVTAFVFAYDGTAPIFITFLKGDRATGVYLGALNFVRIFGILPASLMAAVLPVTSRLWPDALEVWKTLVGRSLKYLFVMALPIAVGLAMLSTEIVALILGADYIDSALVLRFAAWVMIIVFLNYGLTIALISADRERVFVRIAGVALIISVLANLALIGRWGALGAVGASLLTESCIFVAQVIVLVRAGLMPGFPAGLLKPVISVAAMALAVYLARGLGLVAAVLSGAVVYVFILFALRSFEADEMAHLQALWSAVLIRLRTKRKPAHT